MFPIAQHNPTRTPLTSAAARSRVPKPTTRSHYRSPAVRKTAAITDQDRGGAPHRRVRGGGAGDMKAGRGETREGGKRPPPERGPVPLCGFTFLEPSKLRIVRRFCDDSTFSTHAPGYP